MPQNKRSRLVIEPEIQYALIWQLCRQWCLHLAASLMLLSMLQVLLGGFFRPWSEHFQQIWPTLASLCVAMLVLLPAYIHSSFKLSNRFVGPIHRLRMELRAIAEGKPYELLKFRESDFWPLIAKELDDAINVLTHKSESAVAKTSKTATPQQVDDTGESIEAQWNGAAVPGGGVTFPSDVAHDSSIPTR